MTKSIGGRRDRQLQRERARHLRHFVDEIIDQLGRFKANSLHASWPFDHPSQFVPGHTRYEVARRRPGSLKRRLGELRLELRADGEDNAQRPFAEIESDRDRFGVFHRRRAPDCRVVLGEVRHF
jgi:hypothetical protein